MAIEYVKVKNKNSNITKTIMKKDLPEYLAMGWIEIKEQNNVSYFTKIQ